MDDFDVFLNEIPRIENSKNYWFVRTMGGKLFNSFFNDSIIAISYPTIEENIVKELIKGEIDQAKRDIVAAKIPNQKRPGLVIANLKRFHTEIKKGDCVLMPGPSCKTIAVGEIIGDAKGIKGIRILSPDGKEHIDMRFQCSRKIKWLKRASRKNFNPELYGLLNTHQTISNANEYSHWINNILYSFYETGDVYHYIINVKQKRGLNARNLYGVLYELLNTTDEFLESKNIKGNTNHIDTKISLNSPGYIEFLGQTSNVIVVLCFLVLFINGGGLKIKIKDNFELDLSTNSLMKRINEFLNSHADRKLKEKLTSQLGGFQIENPQDIVNILDKINQRNQNET